jgi:hypothetical protein
VRAGLIVACLLVAVSPAHACHRFSVWKYPFPQRCVVAQVQVDRSWFVELGEPSPAIAVPVGRTPEQESDAREHDEAVRAHKDEINGLMLILKQNEREAGYQGVEDR